MYFQPLLHDRSPTCRLKMGNYEPDLQNSQNLHDNLRERSETTLYHDNVYLSLGASLNNRNRTAMTMPRPKNKPLLTVPKLQLWHIPIVQRITIADTNHRDAEGATMGKVRRPEVLSPPTSGKSCAENVVNTKRAQQAKERNSSISTRSTRVGSAEGSETILRNFPKL